MLGYDFKITDSFQVIFVNVLDQFGQALILPFEFETVDLLIIDLKEIYFLSFI